MTATRRPSERRGFSLVEILISIGIIGVLISITLPALAKARSAARQTVSLSNARTIALAFNDHAERSKAWPFLQPGQRLPGVPTTPPPDVIVVPWWPRGTFIGSNGPWSLAFLWPGVLSEIAPWPENYATWVSPGLPTELPDDPFSALPGHDGEEDLSVSYRYSNSFLAKPRLWQEGIVADRSLIESTSPADVRHPSQKVLLWDDDLAYLPNVPPRSEGHWNAPTPMAFADIHADVRNPTEATAGVANPLNQGDSTRLHNTPEGVLGRDY